ncbi:outer membrane lipoprotein chaperone LolA [bacterium SCSIO 12696]|nr:outer membrane lipoprotein chaperone LolA [bacterium SCSIO 12696]
MRLIALVFTVMCCAQGHAGGQPAAERLQALLAPIESMQGQFSQQQQDANGVVLTELSQRGQMQVTRQGQIRWIVDGDFGQQLISDGSTLWFYDPDLEQVTIQAVNPENDSSPALLLMGDFERLSNNYRIEQGKAANQFLLYPLLADSLYELVQIEFSSGHPNAIKVVDNLGEQTLITLDKVSVNPALEEKLFVFDIPEGVDVIHN